MKIFTKISDLFFPPQCIFCDSTLKLAQRPLICEPCMQKYILNDITCPKCGGKILSDDSLMPVCDTCKIAGRYYDGAMFVFDYCDNAQNAMHRYKFSRQLYVGDQIASVLARKLKTAGINRFCTDLVVTVPSDKKRNKNRGFDAAGNLGGVVAKNLHIPYAANAVVRIKEIERQSTLNYSKRQENVRNAFKVTNPDFIKGKRILVIDDIITTGSTLTEMSRILKRAGASYVFVAAPAHTPKTGNN